MVRTTTQETEQAKAQWRRAFDLLSREHRLAIINFCFASDRHVAGVALNVAR